MIVSGTELFHKCLVTLQIPKPTRLDLDKCFHDLNLLLETGFVEEAENQDAIWFNIGICLMKMNRKVMAMEAFKKTMEINPEFLEALNNLGYCYKKYNYVDEARDCFGEIIKRIESGDNKHPVNGKSLNEYYANYASMFVCNGTPDKAIELYDKALSYDPDSNQTKYNKGLAVLEKGDYENGFPIYDLGDRVDKIVNRHYGHESLPVWDGTKGKNIVVIGEQGIGDELMFGTIIPQLAQDANIVLDCHPRLADMFRRSFPNLDVYGTRKDEHFDWGRRYKLEAKILMASLPKYYRKSKKDFPKIPYLVVDSKYDERYKMRLEQLGERPKIGISWRGGTKQTGRNHRYIPMEKFLPLLEMDCDFISLQYDSGILPEVQEFEKKHNVRLNHWPEMLEDYEQTAAIVKNLDLIISVPQSVIHLAGVIGSPLTWQLCPRKTLWQAGVIGEDMPWYGNVRNFWQDESCTWDNVLETVKDELCKLLQTTTES